MIIKDIWGDILIEPEYERLINCKEFLELKDRTQLGLNTSENGKHTRYEHSIGTYYLATKLIDICKRKFSDILNITKVDEDAIKCCALLHDLGHGPFSHVSEKHLDGNHEIKTIEKILDENSEINKILMEHFGIEVIRKIVYLLNIKYKFSEIKDTDSVDLIFVIRKLISGGIDIDRIDYLYRDSYYVNGEINDFSNILENIDLEYINDKFEITFNEKASYSIANFCNKRFELYDTCYVSAETLVLEQIFKKFLILTGTTITWGSSEIDINKIFQNNLSNEDICIKRYANLLDNKKINGEFLIKEFKDSNEYSVFIEQLYESFPILKQFEQPLFTSSAHISIYNEKNKVLINKDGIVLDISKYSKILNGSLEKNKYVVSIDLYLLKELLKRTSIEENEINKLINEIKIYFSPNIEIEKKYCFNEESNNPIEEFKKIKNALNLSSASYIENNDTYYDDKEGILKNSEISVRRRKTNDKEEWTIKRNLCDKTNTLKREEKNFSSKEQLVYFIRKVLNLPINELEEQITLHTKRAKYNVDSHGGKFEIVFDRTIGEINGIKLEPSYMIECELKEGKPYGMYFIDKVIKQFPFIKESLESKKEIALAKNKTREKVKEKKYVKV